MSVIRPIYTDGNQDVTVKATGGQLGGLLEIRNSTLPALIGDQSQPGSLNQMAKAYADRVNNILKAGVIAAGPPQVAGKAILTYDTSLLGATAGTLTISAGFGPNDLAAIQTTPTVVNNGVPNQLANLQNSNDPADQIAGSTFSGFYAKIATDIGNQTAAAKDLQSSQTDLLNQAENLRAEVSGVDLNEQAAKLLEYQKAYEASSKIISVVNDMTSALMDLIH
jgi:flagellar hook-associated protein 1